MATKDGELLGEGFFAKKVTMTIWDGELLELLLVGVVR
jgi:hypothetical protein